MFLKYDDKKNQEFKFNIQNIEISQNNDAAKIICSISKSIERIIKNKYGCITFGINFGQFNDEKINRLLSFFKNWLEKILGPNKNKSSGKIF